VLLNISRTPWLFLAGERERGRGGERERGDQPRVEAVVLLMIHCTLTSFRDSLIISVICALSPCVSLCFSFYQGSVSVPVPSSGATSRSSSVVPGSVAESEAPGFVSRLVDTLRMRWTFSLPPLLLFLSSSSVGLLIDYTISNATTKTKTKTTKITTPCKAAHMLHQRDPAPIITFSPRRICRFSA
jgi:hypothetical protein